MAVFLFLTVLILAPLGLVAWCLSGVARSHKSNWVTRLQKGCLVLVALASVFADLYLCRPILDGILPGEFIAVYRGHRHVYNFADAPILFCTSIFGVLGQAALVGMPAYIIFRVLKMCANSR